MDRAAAGRGRVAFVLKGYPRLSETFIAQEILALERRGLAILIVSLRHPTDRKTHPVHAAIRAERLYLPEYLYQEPARVWRGWRWARRQNGYRRAWRAWLADLWRDPTPNRVRRFGQALVLAAELPQDIGHLHAHFLHTPASVARYAALICGLGWTVSAHAKDIWTIPDWEKREKLGEAEWAVTCTAAGRAHLAARAPSSGAGGAVLSRARSRTLCAAAAPPAGRATAGIRTLRSCCSRSAGRSPKKAMTTSLQRWRCCRPTSPGALCISAAAPLPRICGNGPRASVWRRGSNGGARWRSPRCWPPIARPICLCWPPKSPQTATATGFPMCCWKRRASASPASRRRFPGSRS